MENKNNWLPLFEVIHSDNVDRFKLILKELNLDINTLVNRKSLLNWAAYNNSIQIATFLLSEPDIIVNQQQEEETSPLITAMATSVAVTELLLKRRKDIKINERDYYGYTAYYKACIERNAKTLKLLLDSTWRDQLITDNVDNSGNIAEYWVCASGHIKVAELLTQYKLFDVSKRGKDGNLPMWKAINTAQVLMVKYLLDNVDHTFLDKGINDSIFSNGKYNIERLLVMAIDYKRPQLVKLFLSHVDIRSYEMYGFLQFKCLSLAMKRGCTVSVKYLIQTMQHFALPTHLITRSLLNCILIDSRDRSITRTCYFLWEKTMRSLHAFILLYFIMVGGRDFDVCTTKNFMGSLNYKVTLWCFQEVFESENQNENMLYFAAYHGLLFLMKQILWHASPPVRIASLTKRMDSKNISVLNLSMRYPEMAKYLKKVIRHNRKSFDQKEIDEFSAWYDHLSSISRTIKSNGHKLTRDVIISKFKQMEKRVSEISINPEKDKVHDMIQSLFLDLSQDVRALNPLYAFTPNLVGSGRENTRPFLPNEFDYHLICTEIRRCVDIICAPVNIKENLVEVKQEFLGTLPNALYDEMTKPKPDFSTWTG